VYRQFVLWCQWVVALMDVVLHKKSSVATGVYFVVIMTAFIIFLFLLFAPSCQISTKNRTAKGKLFVLLWFLVTFLIDMSRSYYVSTWAVVVAVHGRHTEQLTVYSLFCVIMTTGIMVLSLSCHFTMQWLIAEQLRGEQSARCQPKIWIAWYVFNLFRVFYFCFILNR